MINQPALAMTNQPMRVQRSLAMRNMIIAMLVMLSWFIADAADAQDAQPTSTARPDEPSSDSQTAPANVAGDVQIYAVNIAAPEPIQILLLRYLELVRRQYDAKMTRDQLDILLNRAERRTRSMLQTEGYFEPTITTTVDDTVTPWQVTLTVQPGEPVIVRDVQIELVGAEKDASERFYESHRVDERWPIHVGDRFRQETWDAGKNMLLREYLIELYPEARIAFSEAKIDPDARTAMLKVQLDSGPPRYFGATEVRGLSRYPQSLVLSNSTIQAGAPYEQARLLEWQGVLQTLPYFQNVLVTGQFERVVDNRVPIVVQVEENPEQRLQFGVGYSSNTGARLQFGYSHFNLRDRGWRFDTLLKLEQREQSIENLLSWPKRAAGWRDSFGFGFKRSDIEGQEERTYKLALKRERKETDIERGYSFNFIDSQQKIDGGVSRSAKALFPAWSWTVRRLDDLLYPRNGYVFNVQVAAGTRAVLSDENFTRLYSKLSYTLPVGARDSVQARLEGGSVIAQDRSKIPIDLLFRAGGDQSIRGYAYQSIGVREGNAVVGSRDLAIASLEYTHWLAGNWGVGVFVDSGDAFDRPSDFKASTGYGLGPRWRSPVGPINVDIAWGERTQKLRLHFSLGVVF